MLLGWRQALYLAVGLAGVGGVLRAAGRRRLSQWPLEAALVLVLYSVWQEGLNLFADHVAGAAANGMRIWHAERRLHVLDERSVQRWFLRRPGVLRWLNYYYADVHVQDVVACLVWLFWRHRHAYRRARNELAWLTLATLALQTVPVAPPRLLPTTGVIDAGRALGYAIYAPNGLHDPSQLIAMPSVHLAWALWAAVAVVAASPSRWRWLVVAHPLLTAVAIVATGYHFWLDGLAAAVLVIGVHTASATVVRARRARDLLPLAVPVSRPAP